jgi:hypothetical protein
MFAKVKLQLFFVGVLLQLHAAEIEHTLDGEREGEETQKEKEPDDPIID